jgi:hypothetical protein
MFLFLSSSTPQSNKMDAFKGVIKKLPKTNYDNIKYLIKFLNKIVENSEKTKMNNTNLGICFGVSLLSNSARLNMNVTPTNGSTSHISSLDNISTKSIDMATATNVFDFILNNHKELFPGEVNFVTNSIRSKPSFHQSTNSIYPTNTQKSSTNSINSVTSSSNFVINQTHIPNNNENSLTSNENQSPNTPLSTLINSAMNNSSLGHSSVNNIMNFNRHIKKNSMDSNRFLDNESTPISTNSSFSSSINSSNNQVGSSMTKQIANIFE